MQFIKREPDKYYVDTSFWIPKAEVNVDAIKNALTFSMMTTHKSAVFLSYGESDHHLVVPREYRHKIGYTGPIVDCRPASYQYVNIPSRIQLDFQNRNVTTQRDALDAMLKSEGGVLQLACGKGKTVIGLELAARRHMPTLIILPETELLRNWKEKAIEHLGITAKEIGLIQAGKFDWKKPLVLSTYQTLAARADSFLLTEEVRRWYGTIIWDEVHHLSAPEFSKSGDLFYGARFGLSATPGRDDGMHIIHEMHVGNVLYKDLRQELKPKIFFLGSGFKLNTNDPRIVAATHDKNKELHLKKMAVYFGSWVPRLDFIINTVRRYADAGRKVIVLSDSINEIVNLCCKWVGFPLFTDIKMPTKEELGINVEPALLTKAQLDHYQEIQRKWQLVLLEDDLTEAKKLQAIHGLNNAQMMLARHDAAKHIERTYDKRRLEYMKKIFEQPSTAGALISDVPSKQRGDILRNKRVVFAIYHYGREGLDCPDLDTIIACEPLSSRNGLQQFMGRVLRRKPGKQEPYVIFIEDNIRAAASMCQKLRRHLRNWPVDEGGPFTYTDTGVRPTWE